MAPATLTEKQQQVYNLLTDDKDPKVIAEALGVSKAAIYSHIRAIKEAGHPIPAKYANVGTGAGRGRTGKRGTGRSAGKSATGTRGRGRAAGKAPTAVVPPTPTPAPTATGDEQPDKIDADWLQRDVEAGLSSKRDAIGQRRSEIASEIAGLEASIQTLREEDGRLSDADATFESAQRALAAGPPAPAEGTPNGSGTKAAVSLSGAAS